MSSPEDTKEAVEKVAEGNHVAPMDEEPKSEEPPKEETMPGTQATKESQEAMKPVVNEQEPGKCEQKSEDDADESMKKEQESSDVVPMDEEPTPDESSKVKTDSSGPMTEETKENGDAAVNEKQSGKCEGSAEDKVVGETPSEHSKIPPTREEKMAEPSNQGGTMDEAKETEKKEETEHKSGDSVEGKVKEQEEDKASGETPPEDAKIPPEKEEEEKVEPTAPEVSKKEDHVAATKVEEKAEKETTEQVKDEADGESPSEAAENKPKMEEEKVETKDQQIAMEQGQVPVEKGDDAVDKDKMKTEEPQEPQDPIIGQVFERYRALPDGQLYPLQGTIVEYREQEGRIPPRWSVRWPTAEKVVQEEEWVENDLYTPALMDGTRKAALAKIQERYQENVEQQFESSTIVSSLILYAALEEALQTSLQQRQQEGTVTSNAAASSSSKSKEAHPPQYYSLNPTSYLQPPTATDTAPSRPNNQVQMTPASLAQRVRKGCSWAWDYLESKQPPKPAAPLLHSSTARRSLRQPKAPTRPVVAEPVPVKQGGRVAMYWLEELTRLQQPDEEEEEQQQEEIEDEQANEPKEAVGDTAEKNNDDVIKAKTPSETEKSRSPKKEEPVRKEVTFSEGVDVFDDMESEESVDAKNDDEDFKAEDAGEDDDEELENVRKERGTLSPAPEPTTSDVEKEEEEHDEDDEIDEDEIMHENPYLQPSLPDLLQHLKNPKTLTGQDIQVAMCESILRIQHNKRHANHGLPVSSLIPVDNVVLEQETPNYPPGQLVLSCVSGETFRELKSYDANVFSRCRFSLDVIGEQEITQQVKRKQELLQQEAEYKERKAWDRWRHRAIHEGHTTWPNWNQAIAAWVKENVISTSNEASAAVSNADEASAAKVEGAAADANANADEALARSLEEENESSGTGRRRTARRAAASGGGGVFYGSQSQLTQKQLGDALVQLVRAHGFQTMMGLQSLVADDSNDPMRRSRVSLGRLVWKRNQLARKSVTTKLSDTVVLKKLSEKPLLTYRKQEQQKATEGENGVGGEQDPPKDVQRLIRYVRHLHATELHLRKLVVKHLAEIPIPIVATAADERPGTTEAMDAADFEDPDSIEWFSSGHNLIGALIYRPAAGSGPVTDMTTCHWYEIQDCSKPIESEGEESTEDGPIFERRTRFRAAPCAAPGEDEYEESETLILTEAQVHAGMKASDLEQNQAGEGPSGGNPFANGSGDRVSLIPMDVDEGDDAVEIQGRIVGHDNILYEAEEEDEEDEVEYRILFLPDSKDSEPTLKPFWATLDVRADDGSSMCQIVDVAGAPTTWYSIEHFDYHQTSDAFRECQNILNWLKRQKSIEPFLYPVDPKALNIPTYPDIVKNPMDVSTMEDKLENGHYSNIAPGSSGRTPVSRMLNGPFLRDVKLIFDNAMLFNPPDDWIHLAAKKLKKSVTKKIGDTSHAANKVSRSSSGRPRQKRSVYVDEDSDVDMYEYESDQDDEYESGRRGGSRKRKRGSRGGAIKDDAASRAIENYVRLQTILRDELRGPFGKCHDSIHDSMHEVYTIHKH